jgi:hypothetical protein
LQALQERLRQSSSLRFGPDHDGLRRTFKLNSENMLQAVLSRQFAGLLRAGAMDGRRLTIDEILVDYVGQFGWQQRRLFLLASLVWVPGAFVTLCMSFVGAQPSSFCLIDKHIKFLAHTM